MWSIRDICNTLGSSGTKWDHHGHTPGDYRTRLDNSGTHGDRLAHPWESCKIFVHSVYSGTHWLMLGKWNPCGKLLYTMLHIRIFFLYNVYTLEYWTLRRGCYENICTQDTIFIQMRGAVRLLKFSSGGTIEYICANRSAAFRVFIFKLLKSRKYLFF
jgi:hypothetical protein